MLPSSTLFLRALPAPRHEWGSSESATELLDRVDDSTVPESLVDPFDEDLWLDRVARRVGFGWQRGSRGRSRPSCARRSARRSTALTGCAASSPRTRGDTARYGIDGEEEALVKELEQRTEAVSVTREYPATFSIWTQLLISIVLPKIVQLFLAAT